MAGPIGLTTSAWWTCHRAVIKVTTRLARHRQCVARVVHSWRSRGAILRPAFIRTDNAASCQDQMGPFEYCLPGDLGGQGGAARPLRPRRRGGRAGTTAAPAWLACPRDSREQAVTKPVGALDQVEPFRWFGNPVAPSDTISKPRFAWAWRRRVRPGQRWCAGIPCEWRSPRRSSLHGIGTPSTRRSRKRRACDEMARVARKSRRHR